MSRSGGRTVIVSGGTGALGRAVVAAFLEAGDHVVVPWIIAAEADAMPRHARQTLVEADVAEPAGADRVIDQARDASVLINGVGGFAGGSPVPETTLEVWDRLYRMNVRTAVCMSRAALPSMRAAGRGGSIVNIASRAAIDCPAGLAAYSASKAAVVALTRTLAAENEDARIRVNAVVPTTIDTPANRAGMPGADFALWTPPSEIARVIVWLCGDGSTRVSGGLVPV
jgi:NAD(P)-dependent dehydrogenase (short-subunit alcohol dehydrogenase family)